MGTPGPRLEGAIDATDPTELLVIMEPTRNACHNRLTRPDGTPGGDVEILCFIEDHSRYVVSVTCHQPVTGPTVVDAFRQAVADQGIPASVLSDIQAWWCPEYPWIVRPAV